MSARNVTLVGSGWCSAGTYNKVRVAGDCNVQGEVRCESFSCAGNCEVQDTLWAKVLKVAGYMKVKGNLEGGKLFLAGGGEIEGHIKAEECKVYGALEQSGTVETEKFIVKGKIAGAKSVNSDHVQIQTLAACEIEEIGASRIQIGRDIKIEETGLVKWFGGNVMMHSTGDAPGFKGGIIEGDEIYLDRAQVQQVRGGKIEIGPYCTIEQVEYTETLTIHPTSTVQTQTHIGN